MVSQLFEVSFCEVHVLLRSTCTLVLTSLIFVMLKYSPLFLFIFDTCSRFMNTIFVYSGGVVIGYQWYR